MDDLLRLVTASDVPFAILFTALFYWYLKESKKDKEEQFKKYDQLQQNVQKDIAEVQKDLKVMLAIWHTLINKEMERRQKNADN